VDKRRIPYLPYLSVDGSAVRAQGGFFASSPHHECRRPASECSRSGRVADRQNETVRRGHRLRAGPLGTTLVIKKMKNAHSLSEKLETGLIDWKVSLGPKELLTFVPAFSGIWHFRNDGPGAARVLVRCISPGPAEDLVHIEELDCHLRSGEVAEFLGQGPFILESLDERGAVISVAVTGSPPAGH
jgi:hypothetical protein